MSLYHSQNRYVILTAFYALSLTGYKMNTHTHPCCEIMYVTKGSCKIYMDQDIYHLEEHQFIFLDANIPHRLFVSEDHFCSMLNLEFQCQPVKTSIDLQELRKESSSFSKICQSKLSLFTGTDTRNLGYSLKDLLSQLEENLSLELRRTENQKRIPGNTVLSRESSQQQYFIRLLFFRTLLELSSCFCENTAAAGTLYLKRACTYISQHLTDEIRIPDIAAYAGINKSYLQSLFSKHMHCPITDYINRKRLEHAIFLLINSSLSITDIAFHSGYNSRQHFGSTFEKYYGMSPRAYRQLHGKHMEASTGANRFSVQDNGSWKNAPL